MINKRKILQFLVRNRKLTPGERLASRIGYMGAGFLVAAQDCRTSAIHSWLLLCVNSGCIKKTMESCCVKYKWINRLDNSFN